MSYQRSSMRWPWSVAVIFHACCVILRGVKGRSIAQDGCNAISYGLPGFRSQMQLFPGTDTWWEGMYKVGFQNSDGTWLAGNFRDTGSDFVAILFPGLRQHKETRGLPELMETLAQNHGYSSLAVDAAGRGESCGSELALNYTAAVSHLQAVC